MVDFFRSVTAQFNKWLRPRGGEQAGSNATRSHPESHARSESSEGGGAARRNEGAAAGKADAKPADGGEKSDLQKNMEKALEMKKEAGPQASIPEHRTAHDGMQPNPNEEIAPSGAIEFEGNTPQLKRSHGMRRSDKG